MPSLVLIKPDAVRLNLVGKLVYFFEHHGLESLELTRITPEFCSHHYIEHLDKEFYLDLERFMCSGPLACMWLRDDVMKVRSTALAIRSQMQNLIKGPANLVHASDSEVSAQWELSLWFENFGVQCGQAGQVDETTPAQVTPLKIWEPTEVAAD